MKKLYTFVFVLFFGIFCFWQNASLQKSLSCPPGEVDLGGGVCAKPAACPDKPIPSGAGVGPGNIAGPSPECQVGSAKACNECCMTNGNCASGTCEIPSLVPPTSGTCTCDSGLCTCAASCSCSGNTCSCTSPDAATACKKCTPKECTLPACTTSTCTIPAGATSGTCPCTTGSCACTTADASTVCKTCPTTGGKCSNDASISCTEANASNVCKTCVVNTCNFNPAVQNPGICRCATPDEILSCATTDGCELPPGYTERYGGPGRGTCVTGPDFSASVGEAYPGSCGCPLVLRFGNNKSGKDTELIGDTKVFFKYDGLTSLRSSWIRGQESVGLLAFDFNRNGSIDNGKELFGEYTNGKKFINGYEALSNLRDKDHNNLVQGKELKDLVLWFDLNEDAISQPSEIKKLAELNIVEIDIPTMNGQEPISLGQSAAYPFKRNGFKQKIGENIVYGGDTFDLWFDGMEVDESTTFSAMN